MNYIKSYKGNNKKKLRGKLFWITVIFIIVFELIIISKNKLKSEDIRENEKDEFNIESACKYIVGVSKDNVIATKQTSVWGSGVIVSKKGYIVTNAHVCGEENSKCYIILDYNNYYEGKVIWSSQSLDLAFVKVDVEFKDCINIGSSSSLRVGQDVYSIGNPINISFQKSVSKGIISGTNRSLEFEEQGTKFYMNNLIQTDASINYGNSGGALIDTNGDLVGINTIKITDADLMGFSIPVDIIQPIIKKLEQSGNFEECTLKIWCLDKYSIYESNIGKKLDNGVFVAQIEANSNAEKAGLKVGDVIRFVDTDEVNTVLDFKKYIFSKNVGENVILKVNRENKELFVNIELEKAM